jgi:hypothetical protein
VAAAVGLRRAGCQSSSGLLEDRLVQPEQAGVGVDTQLVGQLGAQLGVGGQRVGLAAAPVQREHPQAAQPLPEGVLPG